MTQPNNELKKTLGPFMLWGLGVGYVISGMYFGWNLGLAEGGTLGMAVATLFIIVMYVTFTFSYTEMACAIPKAGGAFDYARLGLGKRWGYLAGIAQSIEFIFAPPAIAFAIGAYLNAFLPQLSVTAIAIIAYLIFTGLNIVGVRSAAYFELFVTILAVLELLLFAGVSYTAFRFENLTINALPHGWGGAFAAIPFAIWFFLAIEGVANVAEEAKNPQRNVLIGFGSAIATLVVLCILVFTSAVGVAGWEAIVFPEPGAAPSDSPLPLALAKIVGEGSALYHLLITIGLFGLIASFHGIILAAGRSTLELGRERYVAPIVGVVHPRTKTPVNALIANMLLGIIALLTGKTAEIITLACFGALTLYIVSMIAFFALRKNHADLERPFKTPLYPFFPAIALIIAAAALVALSVYNFYLMLIYVGIVGIGYVAFLWHQAAAASETELAAESE
ncbi:ethanolamine permease [Blastopirellula sp. JC732]|uniref:Ethanolamine permease n=1 Tax=Blastopirellula sediminis TaxID=2894196 RepID=A0A9X1MMR8_9BACT|nr:ethanolamine permease [Blastopirellula sediminis]MCC9607061.1 ethanolamine permease [Blastopirellula sediminis]MCC9629646.1 ethanolamine permease [Blastopirellula sediminis]